MAYIATADWESLGEGEGREAHYRKFELYSLLWDVTDLNQYIVAAAPFGGPIALVRDKTKVIIINKNATVDPYLYLYTAAGKQLAMVPINRWATKSIIAMGWTTTENLCVVLEDGTILIYSLLGALRQQFSLFSTTNITEEKVTKARIWGNGVVGLTNELKLHLIEDLSEPNSRVMPPLGGALNPDHVITCMVVIEPQYTESGSVEVLLGTSGGSIIVVDHADAIDQLIHEKIEVSIMDMALSPGGRFIACFTATGNLVVMSSDFVDFILSFPTKSKKAPLQIIWCGPDSVLLYWKGQLLMIGPFGDYLHWSYTDRPVIYCIQEADCARLLSSNSMEMVIRVSPQEESIRQIGSTAPAAKLFDAMDAYNSGNAKADEYMRSIVDNDSLGEAIEACISAASGSFNADAQRQYIKAAAYGKWFCKEQDADRFAEMFVSAARKMRVLNSLRNYEIGIPLTCSQYDRLTPNVIIDRVINRNQHYLALQICDYLSMSKNKVLLHWAMAKVRSSEDLKDEELKSVIRQKLSVAKGISYADIARTANGVGRRTLATMLLDYEPLAFDQVPLLLGIGEPGRALAKACDSRDADLIYLVMMHLKGLMTAGTKDAEEKEFYKLILSYSDASNLLLSYLRKLPKSKDSDERRRSGSPLDMTKKAYEMSFNELKSSPALLSRQYAKSACMLIEESYGSDRFEDRISDLNVVKDRYQNAESNGCKDLRFNRDVVEEQVQLLRLQQQLEKETNNYCFLDSSVSDTIYNAIRLGQAPKKVDKMVSDFKLPKERFYYLKIKAHRENSDWGELERFANERKSPIGYKPFAEAALSKGNRVLAGVFAMKVAEPEDKKELLLACSMWVEAVQFAAASKNAKMVEEIMLLAERNPDSTLLPILKDAISKASK